jgi:hypothetical protein
LAEECVWVEVPSSDGFNLLIGNRYFAPDITADTLKRYFGYAQHTHNSRVLLLGDLNVVSFDRELGRPHPAISHYYNKLKAEAIFSSARSPRLSQHEYSRNSCQIA